MLNSKVNVIHENFQPTPPPDLRHLAAFGRKLVTFDNTFLLQVQWFVCITDSIRGKKD